MMTMQQNENNNDEFTGVETYNNNDNEENSKRAC